MRVSAHMYALVNGHSWANKQYCLHPQMHFLHKNKTKNRLTLFRFALFSILFTSAHVGASHHSKPVGHSRIFCWWPPYAWQSNAPTSNTAVFVDSSDLVVPFRTLLCRATPFHVVLSMHASTCTYVLHCAVCVVVFNVINALHFRFANANSQISICSGCRWCVSGCTFTHVWWRVWCCCSTGSVPW